MNVTAIGWNEGEIQYLLIYPLEFFERYVKPLIERGFMERGICDEVGYYYTLPEVQV